MSFKNILKNQIFISIVISCLGLFMTLSVFYRAINDIQQEMLIQSRLISKSLDVNKIKTLSKTNIDPEHDEYLLLQKYLYDIISINKRDKYLTVYYMNEKNELSILIMVQNNDIPKLALVMPGTQYHTTTQQILNAFHTRQPAVFRHADERGKFLTSIIPIFEPETGVMIAFLAMDYDFLEFVKLIVQKLIYPIVMFVLLHIIFFIGFNLHDSRKKAIESSQRILKHRKAITYFTVSNDFETYGFIKTLDILSELMSETLHVDRASIWSISEDKQNFICESMYLFDEKKHVRGSVIQTEKFPQLFSELKNKRMMSIPNVPKNKLFNDFYNSYLQLGTGFKSVIFSVFKQDGEIIGLTVLANHTQYHDWQTDEEDFVDTISALISQTYHREKKEKVEKELIETNRRFVNTMENIVDGFMYLDENFTCQLINEQAYGVLNMDHGVLTNKDIWDILPSYISYFLKDIITSSKKNGKALVRIERINELNKWIEFKIYPSNNDIFIFLNDVTKSKKTEQAFINNHRLSVIGEIAYSFAHDFNNFLQVIMTNIQILEYKLDQDNSVKNYIDTIYQTTNDAAIRIQLLQTFAGSSNKSIEYERVNLNKITREAVLQTMAIWKTEAESKGKNIKIKEDYNDIPEIFGNDIELRTAIYNIIKNSVESITKDGMINLATRASNEGVYLQVKDTGCGIKEENFTKVFEPFYTTKSLDIGKGLGLCFVHNAVTEHKGKVCILDSTEKGTILEIFLPYKDYIGKKDDEEIKVSKRQKPVIMWVDDDSLIRDTAVELMKIIGYDAIIAESGDEALEIIKNTKIDILLSDVGMPKMNGWQLVEKINQGCRNGMKIAFITGWGDQITEAQRKQANIDFVLTKPVKTKQLKKLIEDLWN